MPDRHAHEIVGAGVEAFEREPASDGDEVSAPWTVTMLSNESLIEERYVLTEQGALCVSHRVDDDRPSYRAPVGLPGGCSSIRPRPVTCIARRAPPAFIARAPRSERRQAHVRG